MSLDYYLICRRSYDKILDHIESIIYSFKDMNDLEEDVCEISDEYIDIKCNKHFFFRTEAGDRISTNSMYQ